MCEVDTGDYEACSVWLISPLGRAHYVDGDGSLCGKFNPEPWQQIPAPADAPRCPQCTMLDRPRAVAEYQAQYRAQHQAAYRRYQAAYQERQRAAHGQKPKQNLSDSSAQIGASS